MFKKNILSTNGWPRMMLKKHKKWKKQTLTVCLSLASMNLERYYAAFLSIYVLCYNKTIGEALRITGEWGIKQLITVFDEAMSHVARKASRVYRSNEVEPRRRFSTQKWTEQENTQNPQGSWWVDAPIRPKQKADLWGLQNSCLYEHWSGITLRFYQSMYYVITKQSVRHCGLRESEA